MSLDIILDNLRKNVENSKKILLHAVRKVPKERKCECADALKYAIVTRPEAIPQMIKDKLNLLTGKYFK